MIVWIASFSRSGDTFFRIMLNQIYGVPTYAAFVARETLLLNDAGDLVNYRALPEAVQTALDSVTINRSNLLLKPSIGLEISIL